MSHFDTAASTYDTDFTHSSIGRLQRAAVYRVLEQTLNEYQPQSLLEINCGTGADALWLAERGLSVTATDISEGMILAAKNKIQGVNPAFSVAGIEQLAEHFSGRNFDGLLSNFGGLNCMPEAALAKFFDDCRQILRPGAFLALVLMPKNTLWEKLYFLAKFDFNSFHRRKKGFSIADVKGEKVPTFYYNPSEIVTLAGAGFVAKKVTPIGFWVPPSYLQPYFDRHPAALRLLGKMEKTVRNRSGLARYADHYCIVLQKK